MRGGGGVINWAYSAYNRVLFCLMYSLSALSCYTEQKTIFSEIQAIRCRWVNYV